MGQSWRKNMAKNIIIIVVLGIILILIACYILFKPTPTGTTTIKLGNTQYSMEIAKTPSQQYKGLGGRTSLCPNCGMIFVFPFNSILPFWMKDTLIPLDMIWIKDDGTIVSIQTAPTDSDPSNPKKIYQNSVPAKYVIELNAGDAQKIGLKENDKININL